VTVLGVHRCHRLMRSCVCETAVLCALQLLCAEFLLITMTLDHFADGCRRRASRCITGLRFSHLDAACQHGQSGHPRQRRWYVAPPPFVFIVYSVNIALCYAHSSFFVRIYQHMLPIRATRAVCLVYHACPPLTASSCLLPCTQCSHSRCFGCYN